MMYCPNCGKQINDAVICPFCGTSLEEYITAPSPAPEKPEPDMSATTKEYIKDRPTSKALHHQDSAEHQKDDDRFAAPPVRPLPKEPNAAPDEPPQRPKPAVPADLPVMSADFDLPPLPDTPAKKKGSAKRAGKKASEQIDYPETVEPGSLNRQSGIPAAQEHAGYHNNDRASVKYSGYVTDSDLCKKDHDPVKKKKLIIIITAATVVLIAAAGAIIFFLTAPSRGYSHAMDLKNSGDYQAAIDAFTEMDGFSDSEDQIIECRYLLALDAMANGEYDKAIGIFTDLGDYKDSADQIMECRYQKALDEYFEGNYDIAQKDFESFGDYKDSRDMVKACKCGIAAALIDSDPEKAIEILEAVGDYEYSKSLLKDAKMSYCKAHKSNDDENTYEYLKELLEDSYAGAAEMYTELYSWKLDYAFFNDDKDNDDPSSAMTVFPASKAPVFHYRFIGGPPNGELTVTYVGVYPNGSAYKEPDFKVSDGEKWVITYSNVTKGTLRITLKDSTGKVYYNGSITIT